MGAAVAGGRLAAHGSRTRSTQAAT
jgi:hypothetical protein